MTSTAPASSVPESSENIQEELIHTVLEPWRPQELRRIAERYIAHNEQLGGELVVLRTYYGGGNVDDEKLRAWLEEADPFDESLGGRNNRWWRVLDDATLFGVSQEDGWQSVYNVLPELASPHSRRAFGDDDVEAVKELVFAAAGDEQEPEEDDYEDAVMAVVATSAVILLVADQQAFEEGEFGLVFQDKKGNIIRQGTINPTEVQNLLHYNSRGALFESEYWLDAAVGKKYKTRGEIMRSLLPVVMADTE